MRIDRRRTVSGVLAATMVAGGALAIAAAGRDGPDDDVPAAEAAPAAASPTRRIPPSVAFPDTRRRGDSVVRQGVVVGVQIEALDAVVRPDGSTQPGFPLPIGTDFFLAEDLFAPDPASPRDPGGESIGTGRTRCVVEPPQGLVITCDVSLELVDGSSITGVETIDFRTITPEQPLTAALAITGGTGQLTGATGECTLTDREDHDVSGVSFYDCRIAQPYGLVRDR